jgi:hypothetical protein
MLSDTVAVSKYDAHTVRLRFTEAKEGFAPKDSVVVDYPLAKIDKLIHELGTLKNKEVTTE